MTCWAKPVRPIAPAIFSSEVDAEHKLENLYDGRAQYDDHHRRQDQQNQRQSILTEVFCADSSARKRRLVIISLALARSAGPIRPPI